MQDGQWGGLCSFCDWQLVGLHCAVCRWPIGNRLTADKKPWYARADTKIRSLCDGFSFSLTPARYNFPVLFASIRSHNPSHNRWSSLLKDQGTHFPAAVRRMREHCPQNGCVPGSIIPSLAGSAIANESSAHLAGGVGIFSTVQRSASTVDFPAGNHVARDRRVRHPAA